MLKNQLLVKDNANRCDGLQHYVNALGHIEQRKAGIAVFYVVSCVVSDGVIFLALADAQKRKFTLLIFGANTQRETDVNYDNQVRNSFCEYKIFLSPVIYLKNIFSRSFHIVACYKLGCRNQSD